MSLSQINTQQIPKGLTKRDACEKKNADILPLATLMKYFEPLFAILQSCWPSHPNLQGLQITRPQWWLNLRT